MIHRTLTPACLTLLTGTLIFFACSSDNSTVEPEVTDPVYIWAGNGAGGFGEMGKLPRKTRLYWPQDVTFTPDGRPMVIDWNNHRIIAIDADGNFVLVAGASDNDFGDPCPPAP